MRHVCPIHGDRGEYRPYRDEKDPGSACCEGVVRVEGVDPDYGLTTNYALAEELRQQKILVLELKTKMVNAICAMRDRAESCRKMAKTLEATRYPGEAFVQRMRADAYEAAAVTLQEIHEGKSMKPATPEERVQRLVTLTSVHDIWIIALRGISIRVEDSQELAEKMLMEIRTILRREIQEVLDEERSR